VPWSLGSIRGPRAPRIGPRRAARFAEITERYELEMDFESVVELCERFNVMHPMAR
jgi:hypothetical protein